MLNSAPSRVLVVEDEPDLNRLIAFNLQASHFEPLRAHTGARGLELAMSEVPGLIILDLMLPDIAGTEVCRQLKEKPETRAIPVVVLTACASESERVRGFELGAEDYVTKPFSMRELVLRVRAVLRRRRQKTSEGLLSIGHIEMDLEAHRVRVSGQDVSLTRSEFQILTIMLKGQGRVFSREDLLDEVWGGESNILDRTVDAHIMRLRKKLGDAADHVETVRGVGYRAV